MRQALYILVLSLLTACSIIPSEWYEDSQEMRELHMPAQSYSILPPPAETIFTGNETVYQNNYVLNETRVAKVGDIVLRVQAFKKDNFITREMILENPVTITIDKVNYTLPAKKYPIFGLFEQGEETFYVLPKYKHYYFLVNMHGEIQDWFLYEIKGNDKVSRFPDKAKISPRSARMKRISESFQSKLPFLDFEVIYDGIKNNQIVLFYKNAVPGTNGGSGSFNTLAYPANSTMIAVEGRLLRILRADNEMLSYIVIKE
ncbi:MAG: hypothetical protein J5787_03265 [Alphaproteobacteria bacterium]|nr:hypothetical protein [Alphaproteobacteria bacterium]